MLEWREYPQHLSYSQAKSIQDCGERFRLERGYGITFPPYWATVGGSGFHTFSQCLDEVLALGDQVTEFWEERDLEASVRGRSVDRPDDQEPQHWEATLALREERAALEVEIRALAVVAAKLNDSGVIAPDEAEQGHDILNELWRVSFRHAITEDLEGLLRKNPDQADTRYFRNSARGKAGVKFPQGEDESWWNHHGPDMLRKYMHWRATSGWSIPFVGDSPAIELDVSCELGDIPIQAYLDRVFLNPTWTPAQPAIVDHKSGRTVPKEGEQLGMYATCLELLGLPRPPYGHYYDARKGKLSEAYPLGDYTIEYFQWKYQNAKYVRDNGLLQPNTASQYCRSCTVKDYCFAVDGQKSHLVPRPWVEAAERRKVAASAASTLSISPV